MGWSAITKGWLHEARVAALVDACDSAAKASGQANRAAGIIAGVVAEIRNAVASADGNQVDADTTTIPDGLRDLAVDLIIARLKGTLEIALTQDERDTVDWRRRQLNQVAAGTLQVDAPGTAIAPEVQGGALPSFGERSLNFKRSDQDGI
jgi:hypothetical protein